MRILQDWIYYCEDDNSVDHCLRMVDHKVVGVDTETTGLDPTEDGCALRLVQIYSPESDKCAVFDTWALSESSLKKISDFLIDKRLKVFHNAKFDMKFLCYDMKCRILDGVFCTMLASQLTYCGITFEDGAYVQHSLAVLVYRHFNKILGKDLQTSDWRSPNIGDDQIIYAARDAKWPVKLRPVLKNILRDQGQMRIAKIEFDCVPAVVEIELTGMKLDVPRWKNLARKQHLRMTRLEAKISESLNPSSMLFAGIPTFKVSSHHQLKDQFRRNNIPIPIKRKTGKETTDSDHLEKIKHLHPSIPLLIKYSSIKQYHNAFGEKFLRHINPIDGMIHPDIKQNDLLTGRFAFSNPNLQQIPSLKMYRVCFIAPDGTVMIISDYSQIELRILAHLSQDVNMCRGFNEGVDFHTYTASLVFNTVLDKVSSVQRRRAKDLNFGIVYGIGVDHFSESAGISVSEGERLMKNYFDSFEGLEYFLEVAGKEGRYQKRSFTIGGRLVKYNFEDGDKLGASKAERNGKNTPAQGTSADITKLALGWLIREYNDRGYSDVAKLCHTVHDEIISICPPEISDECLEIQDRVMRLAGEEFVTRVPIKIDSKVSTRWEKD